MKIAILDILKRTFTVVKDKNTTVISFTKQTRKFKRADGLYWFESGCSSEMNKIPLKGWKPTSIMKIFSVFG